MEDRAECEQQRGAGGEPSVTMMPLFGPAFSASMVVVFIPPSPAGKGRGDSGRRVGAQSVFAAWTARSSPQGAGHTAERAQGRQKGRIMIRRESTQSAGGRAGWPQSTLGQHKGQRAGGCLLPSTNPPPWIQTVTGRLSGGHSLAYSCSRDLNRDCSCKHLSTAVTFFGRQT